MRFLFFQVQLELQHVINSFIFLPFPILVLSVSKELALENCHAIILACYPLPPLMGQSLLQDHVWMRPHPETQLVCQLCPSSMLCT